MKWTGKIYLHKKIKQKQQQNKSHKVEYQTQGNQGNVEGNEIWQGRAGGGHVWETGGKWANSLSNTS